MRGKFCCNCDFIVIQGGTRIFIWRYLPVFLKITRQINDNGEGLMAKRKTKFICNNCGYESPKWMGKCPGCGEWNTMVEEVEPAATGRRGAFAHSQGTASKAVPITSVETVSEPRIFTNMAELNRVLGGGIVKGSLVLIGGDPGIGKSTLLLQVSSELAQKGHTVLYISGEESLRQTKLRSERIGVASENLLVYSETNLEEINRTIEQTN